MPTAIEQAFADKMKADLNGRHSYGSISIEYRDALLKEHLSATCGNDFETVITRTLWRYGITDMTVEIFLPKRKKRKGAGIVSQVRFYPHIWLGVHSRKEMILTLLHEIVHWLNFGSSLDKEKQVEAM